MAPPKLFVQVQGQGSVSADQMNSTVQWCQSVTQLRAFIGLPTMTVYVQGINVPDDGGQGLFFWQSTVTEPDDGSNYIIPLGGNGGGWIRLGGPFIPSPEVTGQLSAVSDSNAKAVLTSIISALVTLGLITNGTT